MSWAQITTKRCCSCPSAEIARCRSSAIRTTRTLKWRPHLRCTWKTFLPKKLTIMWWSMMRSLWTRQLQMPPLLVLSSNWARWIWRPSALSNRAPLNRAKSDPKVTHKIPILRKQMAFPTARATPTSWSSDGSGQTKWSHKSTKMTLLRNTRSSTAVNTSRAASSTNIRPSIPRAATSE